jgi:uncharacterized protein (TIGR02001 family)
MDISEGVRILLWSLCLANVAAHAGDRLGGSLALTSDYRLEGISQSNTSPAVQAEIHYDDPSGWFAGLWGSNVGLYGQKADATQLNVLVGRQWLIAPDWRAKTVISHYAHPWDSPQRAYDYDELSVSVAFRDQLAFSTTYSPDVSLYSRYGLVKNRTTWSYDFTVHTAVRGHVSASGGVGFHDLHTLTGTGYWYGSAGLAYDTEHLHFDLSRIQTDAAARRLFYSDIARPTWVGTVIWTFNL